MIHPMLRVSRRALIVASAVGVWGRSLARAQGTLDGLPEGALRERLDWFIDALNGSDRTLTANEVEAHFTADFLQQVPADQVIATVGQLRDVLGTVEVGRVAKASDATQAGVQLLGSTGVSVRLTIWIDPETSLIGGLMIEPDASSRDDATAEASAIASPVPTEPVPAMDDILPAYQDAVAELREQGRAVAAAMLGGDDATFVDLVTPDVVAALGEGPASTLLAQLETNILHMELPAFGVVFDGHVTRKDISGSFHQAGPGSFTLRPETTQEHDIPSGSWTGAIFGGGGRVSIEVTFTGTGDALEATLSIPSQGMTDEPLSNVTFAAQRPVGERLEERVLPLGAARSSNLWSGGYAWGPTELILNVSIDEDGSANGITTVSSPPLPPDPAERMTSETSFRVPFDGAWLVIWGGDTEFTNYHAVVPAQRHAYDIAVWRDGATCTGDGSRNDQYHAWDQPVLAPSDGRIVTVLDGMKDTPPGAIADPSRSSEIDPQGHPAGNHVVIEVGEDEYILIGHFQQGTISVAEGDTVTAGTVLGRCGSSGNSSEPHIHIQRQNAADLLSPGTIALPLEFSDFVADGEAVASGEVRQGQIVAPAGDELVFYHQLRHSAR